MSAAGAAGLSGIKGPSGRQHLALYWGQLSLQNHMAAEFHLAAWRQPRLNTVNRQSNRACSATYDNLPHRNAASVLEENSTCPTKQRSVTQTDKVWRHMCLLGSRSPGNFVPQMLT